MATYIKTLKDVNGDTVLPRTSSAAVLMADGSTSLETKLSTLVAAVDTVEDVALSPLASEIIIADVANNYTSNNVEGVLTEIADHFSALSADAVDINITDTNGYYTSTNVEGALDEVGFALANITLDTSSLTVNSSIIPDTTEVYDLGSTTNKFRDLHLSGTTIYLGTNTITTDAGNLVLPAGTVVDDGLGGTVASITQTELDSAVAPKAIQLYEQTINADFTISGTKNALSVGPITIADGVTVTIEDGATWVIV